MRWAVIRAMRTVRVLVLICLDSAAWFFAMWLAVALRLETWSTSPVLTQIDAAKSIPIYGVALVAGIAALTHLLLAWLTRLHQGRSKLGSFEELFVLVSVILAAGCVATAANATNIYVPRTVPFVATCLVVILASWPRGLWRILVNEPRSRRVSVVSEPLLLVGAGEGGRQLVDSIHRDPMQQWHPVAYVDDDKRKRHFRHRGVRVEGTVDDLARVAERHHAETIVVAIPSADSSLLHRINDLASEADITVKVLPAVQEILGGVDHSQIRDIEPTDLLGRRPVDTDVEAIAGYLSGKRVLVTGAGGSIGSELCRQIRRYGPAELLMLDSDECSLHALLLSIHGRADLESESVILANICNAERMHEIMRERRPEVVFHAAALKHVNLLETHPTEAVHTNVMGTLNVLEAAADIGVERFVNISTDKAADPVNVLGYTKCIAEGLTAAFADDHHGTFLSVRFGNVLGTSGSVLKTFESQIAGGGPITVTHPEVTRFFMTVNEAVQLVIQAGAIGRPREALVLDMGDPVPIAEVARQLVQNSGQPIKIVYTGLKPGEKMHEVLFASGETDVRPIHPLISHVAVPPVSRQTAIELRSSHQGTIRDHLELLARAMVVQPTEPSRL